MLKNPFFELLSVDHDDKVIGALIKIDAGHAILKGHFPGRPVLPGACMVQILKEVLESAFRVKLILNKAGNLKFLSIVDPGINDLLRLTVTYTVNGASLKINAKLLVDDAVCFKFQGVFNL